MNHAPCVNCKTAVWNVSTRPGDQAMDLVCIECGKVIASTDADVMKGRLVDLDALRAAWRRHWQPGIQNVVNI